MFKAKLGVALKYICEFLAIYEPNMPCLEWYTVLEFLSSVTWGTSATWAFKKLLSGS